MIPSKAKRDEWRKLAMETVMISAVGEYTPEEFLVLLDAVDELEQKLLRMQEAGAVAKLIAAAKDIRDNPGTDPHGSVGFCAIELPKLDRLRDALAALD